MPAPASSTEVFLLAMLIIFTVPYLTWRLANTDYYAPLVVVQIIVGVLLGPSALGAVFPDHYASVFGPQVIQSLDGIACWAVMIFVMIAGIELDLKAAWEQRHESLTAATLALSFPLAAGCAVAAAMATEQMWVGPAAMKWQFVVGVGMACAVTALPVMILLMEKLAILRAPLGQRIMRYASLDDIAIWGVLALILLDWTRMGHQLSFLLLFALAAAAYRHIMMRIPDKDRWHAGLIWLIACSLAADWAGLHYMVGAFLAGLVTDAHWFDQEKMDWLREHVLLIAMPIYFLSAGLKTQWSIGSFTVIAVGAALFLAAAAGKLIGVYVAGKLLKWKKGEASIVGWLLQTKGLVMIVFANVLLDKGLISKATFTALVLSAVISTMLTVPMVYPKLHGPKTD